MKYKPPVPDIQIAFCQQLLDLRGSILQQALFDTLIDAKQESPTTSDFYFINELADQDSTEFKRFRENIIGLTGIEE